MLYQSLKYSKQIYNLSCLDVYHRNIHNSRFLCSKLFLIVILLEDIELPKNKKTEIWTLPYCTQENVFFRHFPSIVYSFCLIRRLQRYKLLKLKELMSSLIKCYINEILISITKI